MKHYAIVRKWRIPFTPYGIATRRYVTLDDAVEFLFQRQMVFGDAADVRDALRAGAIFANRKFDVLSAAKMTLVSDETKYYEEK